VGRDRRAPRTPVEEVLPGQRKPLPEVLLGRGVGQKRANEKGREKGLEKGPCQQCCRAVSPVPKKPTRAGHGGHNLGSLPVANLECFAAPISARHQYRATITRPRAAVIRWLLSTQRPQAGKNDGSVPARGWGALIHYREDHSMPHNLLIRGQC